MKQILRNPNLLSIFEIFIFGVLCLHSYGALGSADEGVHGSNAKALDCYVCTHIESQDDPDPDGCASHPGRNILVRPDISKGEEKFVVCVTCKGKDKDGKIYTQRAGYTQSRIDKEHIKFENDKCDNTVPFLPFIHLKSFKTCFCNKGSGCNHHDHSLSSASRAGLKAGIMVCFIIGALTWLL